jgi:hypothetical protein
MNYSRYGATIPRSQKQSYPRNTKPAQNIHVRSCTKLYKSQCGPDLPTMCHFHAPKRSMPFELRLRLITTPCRRNVSQAYTSINITPRHMFKQPILSSPTQTPPAHRPASSAAPSSPSPPSSSACYCPPCYQPH